MTRDFGYHQPCSEPDPILDGPLGGAVHFSIMRIVELLNISRRETPIFYRRVYTAQAVFESARGRAEKDVQFTVEHRPVGGVDIQVDRVENLDYPLIPVVRELKSYIADLDKRGALPWPWGNRSAGLCPGERS